LRLADLAWTRATGWREALAHAFDDGVPRVTSVRVTYGGASPSTTVRFFATWIQRALPSAKVSMESAAGEPGLQSVTLTGDRDISITRIDGSSVEVRSGERLCRSLLPSTDEEVLMREELSILNADPVFDRVLA
jgi:glucose-6-phosphate dehydrogenase assembly protein OpcA